MSHTTVGNALTRARDDVCAVELLVEGHWIQGHVSAVDGYGVVLNRAGGDHSVIRLDSIVAVTVAAESPVSIPSQPARHMAVAG